MPYVELDVNYPDDPKIIAAGEKAEVLYLRSLCYAQRTLSDGFIPDVQVSRFHLSGVPARVKTLLDVGLWERDERGGYLIAAWSKRNRPANEIRAAAASKSRGGAEGNHKRWHQDRPQPGCEWCDRIGPPNRTTDRSTESIAVPEPLPPSSDLIAEAIDRVGGGDVLEKACLTLAVREADRRGGEIHSREGWVKARTKSLMIEHADETARALAIDPSLSSDSIVRYLSGERNVVPIKPWVPCGECDEGFLTAEDAEGRTVVALCACRKPA